jgi:cytosine/adenosine deaminase-related metal-dependent hydrolase
LGARLAERLRRQSTPISESLDLFDQLHSDNRGQCLTRIQLAPANLHWCSDEALLALEEKSRSANVPMHMHLLETSYQKEYGRRRSNGKTAVRHLHDLGILSSRLTLGHGVWLNEEDIEIAAQTGVCICHNCSSNFRLRSGIAPLNSFEARGITTAIGIDEAGINDDRDMIQEMRMVLKTHRTPGMNEDDVPTVPQVVRMATEGGAKTTAFGDQIGRLEQSRFFDALLVDWNEATFPFQDTAIPPLDAIIHRAKVSAVKAVYVNGEIVYQDGKFTKIDRDEVMREIAEQMAHELTPEERVQKELVTASIPYVRRFYEGYREDSSYEAFSPYNAKS